MICQCGIQENKSFKQLQRKKYLLFAKLPGANKTNGVDFPLNGEDSWDTGLSVLKLGQFWENWDGLSTYLDLTFFYVNIGIYLSTVKFFIS